MIEKNSFKVHILSRFNVFFFLSHKKILPAEKRIMIIWVWNYRYYPEIRSCRVIGVVLGVNN